MRRRQPGLLMVLSVRVIVSLMAERRGGGEGGGEGGRGKGGGRGQQEPGRKLL